MAPFAVTTNTDGNPFPQPGRQQIKWPTSEKALPKKWVIHYKQPGLVGGCLSQHKLSGVYLYMYALTFYI